MVSKDQAATGIMTTPPPPPPLSPQYEGRV